MEYEQQTDPVTPANACFEHTQCREDEEVAAILGVHRTCT